MTSSIWALLFSTLLFLVSMRARPRDAAG